MFNSHNLLKLLLIVVAFLSSSCTPLGTSVEAKSIVKQEQVKHNIDYKQLQCLADNIYFEARGEPLEGQAAVARVVVNRVVHGFASTPCQVVYQSVHVQRVDEDTEESLWVKMCQFSWVCEGKKNPNRTSKQYQNSLQVAHDVLIYDKYKEVIPSTVLFFHNLTVTPKLKYTYKKRIGNHIFYSKKKRR